MTREIQSSFFSTLEEILSGSDIVNEVIVIPDSTTDSEGNTLLPEIGAGMGETVRQTIEENSMGQNQVRRPQRAPTPHPSILAPESPVQPMSVGSSRGNEYESAAVDYVEMNNVSIQPRNFLRENLIQRSRSYGDGGILSPAHPSHIYGTTRIVRSQVVKRALSSVMNYLGGLEEGIQLFVRELPNAVAPLFKHFPGLCQLNHTLRYAAQEQNIFYLDHTIPDNTSLVARDRTHLADLGYLWSVLKLESDLADVWQPWNVPNLLDERPDVVACKKYSDRLLSMPFFRWEKLRNYNELESRLEDGSAWGLTSNEELSESHEQVVLPSIDNGRKLTLYIADQSMKSLATNNVVRFHEDLDIGFKYIPNLQNIIPVQIK